MKDFKKLSIYDESIKTTTSSETKITMERPVITNKRYGEDTHIFHNYGMTII